MLSRREFAQLAAGIAAACALPGCKRNRNAPAAEAAEAARTPRYFVQLLLSGGHDPVYTTDPKERSEVEADIDLPERNDIVEGAGLRLGASFAPLRPLADRLSIVNGVHVGTANHETGIKQFLRLKTNPSEHMPSLLEIIGARRDGQPLGVATLNIAQRVLHSPGYFGRGDTFYLGADDVFSQAGSAEPRELRALAEVLRAHAKELDAAARITPEAAVTRDNYLEVAAFFERSAKLERWQPEVRAADYSEQIMSAGLDRALWLLEHDLCRCVFVDVGILGWDTHIANADRQLRMNAAFVTHFRRFLQGLAKTENAHGPLADQTVVIAGSDLGRFPRLNDMQGKDHLPQTSFFFSGPGFSTGKAFGGTGKKMEGLPIDLATGSTARGTHRPYLDDIGTTMLHLAGVEPEAYGYTGRVLEFLLA